MTLLTLEPRGWLPGGGCNAIGSGSGGGGG